jgi:hypothetical protein
MLDTKGLNNKMKKAVILCFLFSMAFFSFNGQNIEDRLMGNWRLVGWYDDIPRDINKDGDTSVDLFSQWQGCKKQSTLILSEDHNGKVIYNGEINNPKCPPDFKKGSFFTTGPWEITDGNKLGFTGDDYYDTYEIIELNSDSLVLKGSGFMTCCDMDISYFTGGYLKFKRE